MQFWIPVITRYSSTIVQFMITLLVANCLSPGDAGTYLMLFGVVTATCVAAGLGAPDGAIQLAPRARVQERLTQANGMIWSAFTVGFQSAVLQSILFGVSVWLASGRSLVTSMLAGLWMLGYALNFAASQCLVAQGKGQLGTFTYYGVINWTTVVIIALYLCFPVSVSLSGMILCAAVGAIAGSTISTLFFLRGSRRTLMERSRPLELVRTGVPIAIGRVAQSGIIWSPVWLSGLFLSSSDAAGVAIASRLVMAAGAAIAAIRFAVRSLIVEYAVQSRWQELEVLGKGIAKPATALCLLALIGVLTVGQYILPKVFGADYGQLWWMTSILLIGVLVESMAGPTDECLKLLGESRFILLIQLAIFALGFLLEGAMAYITGLSGMLIASAFSFACLYYVIVRRFVSKYGVNPSLVPVFR